MMALFQDYMRYQDDTTMWGALKRVWQLTPGSVLDVGCGSGRLLPWMYYNMVPPGGKLVGVDLDSEQVGLARRHIATLQRFPQSVASLEPREVIGLAVALEQFGLSYAYLLDFEDLNELEIREMIKFYKEPSARHLDGNRIEKVRAGLEHARLWFDFSGLELMIGDARRLPLPDNSFDLVFLNDVLLYSPPDDAQKVLNEALRVARGYVIFSTYPTRDHAPSIFYTYCFADSAISVLLGAAGSSEGNALVGGFAGMPDYQNTSEQWELLVERLKRTTDRVIPVNEIRRIITTLHSPEKAQAMLWPHFLESADAYYLYNPQDITRMIGECDVEIGRTGAMLDAARFVFRKRKQT